MRARLVSDAGAVPGVEPLTSRHKPSADQPERRPRHVTIWTYGRDHAAHHADGGIDQAATAESADLRAKVLAAIRSLDPVVLRLLASDAPRDPRARMAGLWAVLTAISGDDTSGNYSERRVGKDHLLVRVPYAVTLDLRRDRARQQ